MRQFVYVFFRHYVVMSNNIYVLKPNKDLLLYASGMRWLRFLNYMFLFLFEHDIILHIHME